MRNHPDILIITLYCGENEIDACKKSVRTQNWQGRIDHIIIADKNNIDAHAACYRTIMDRSAEYDLFIKLDADMVFCHDNAVADMVLLRHKHHNPLHCVFPVHDMLPGRLSIGIHMFARGCQWAIENHDPLFIDANPLNAPPVKIYDAQPPLVTHMPDPSDFQSWHFGMHRAAKAFQWTREEPHPQGLESFRILRACAARYKKTGDPRIKMALMGAESVRITDAPLVTGDKSPRHARPVPRMSNNVQSIDFWMRPWRASFYWWRHAGLRILRARLVQKTFAIRRNSA